MLSNDAFYTKPKLAASLVSSALDALEKPRPESFLDPTCGRGGFLLGAEQVLPTAAFLGIDRDRVAVAWLRRHRPSWTLSVLDVADGSAVGRSNAWRAASRERAVILLNPPFSMGARKGVVDPSISPARCSVAMWWVRLALARFAPESAVAIVPESLLWSEIDREARVHLKGDYHVRVLREIPRGAFRACAANSLGILLERRSTTSSSSTAAAAHGPIHTPGSDAGQPNTFWLVRGGLPVHETTPGRTRYIHTTELAAVGAAGRMATVPRVRGIGRGHVSGAVWLLPRVGFPGRAPCIANFQHDVQLSDCVIGVGSSDVRAFNHLHERLSRDWPRCTAELYKGTGARYVTVGRLRSWLTENLGSDVNVLSSWPPRRS